MVIRNLLVVINEVAFTVLPGLDRLTSKSLLSGASLYPQTEGSLSKQFLLDCPGAQPHPGRRRERGHTRVVAAVVPAKLTF